jgi:hypothetical protein
MENYITTILVTILIGIGYLSYKVSRDLESKEDACEEIK